ncbi:SDR family NAD(P)-dependent oxidoreductase [Streptomyces bohaiensis]|uniref:SDR family NAD(P)-dependent oxidoreductase n=1 Tax=Streptomyces bohaiensis TaxID=1431344 RepID=A0ABX1C6R2_9ACTN|nr:SDR family NAD(P)-dependent oxidoreductase [Streptomyces bohaiensis]NJQ13670.1 SDR family NAD(P)-dependent oxidoreductase [Streptomyces bohaiensis]
MNTAPAASRAVLITGCSTGVGRAAAWRFLRAGHPVYATAREVAGLAELADAGATTLPLDVTDETAMTAAVRRVEAEHGAVGILVNNAAYGIQAAFEATDLDEARRMFETNFFGLSRLSQLVLPAMRDASAGRIVNVTSMGAHFSLPGAGFLHATKYAVEAVTDALRLEVRGFGIDVVLVEPGPIRTPFPTKINATIPGPTGGPYDQFHAAVEQRVSAAYVERRTSLALSPEKVAQVIERAALTRRPRARYPVGLMSRGLIAVSHWLPDAAVDAITRSQFPGPRPTTRRDA